MQTVRSRTREQDPESIHWNMKIEDSLFECAACSKCTAESPLAETITSSSEGWFAIVWWNQDATILFFRQTRSWIIILYITNSSFVISKYLKWNISQKINIMHTFLHLLRRRWFNLTMASNDIEKAN